MNIINTSKNRNIYFIMSTILVVASICAIIFIKPNIGIDFSGGVLMDLEFNNTVTKDDIRNSISNLTGINNLQVQTISSQEVIIRTNQLSTEEVDLLRSTLNQKIGEYTELRYETVGPTISRDLTKKAIWAIVLAAIAIILYVAYAFRQVQKPANSWRFGITAIIALAHDLIISIGIYIILGKLFGFEIDSLFIVAILTILGYSVNDTIVIYDRIRENLKTNPSYTFSQNVNISLGQSLARSINTSMTLILVLLCLILLGGESLRGFISLLLIGSIVGTYSSIFLAPPLLIAWQNYIQKKSQKS